MSGAEALRRRPPMTALNVSPAEARNLLATLVAAGQRIVLSAAMVGDRDDFDVWLQRCGDWTGLIGDSLSRIYGDESATTFQRTTMAAEQPLRWQDGLRTEVERVQEVLDMLVSLSDGVR